MLAWKTLSRREVFAIPGRYKIFVEQVELPDGRRVDDYIQIEGSDFVVIFAETVSGLVVCLRQYRHGARRIGLELPAGGIDGGEDPKAAAERELLEETGYGSGEWEAVGSFLQSANHRLGQAHVFRVRNAVRIQEPNSGDLEESRIELLGNEQLRAAVRANEVVNAATLAALLLVLA